MISKRVAIAFLAARMVFKMIGPVVVIKRKRVPSFEMEPFCLIEKILRQVHRTVGDGFDFFAISCGDLAVFLVVDAHDVQAVGHFG